MSDGEVMNDDFGEAKMPKKVGGSNLNHRWYQESTYDRGARMAMLRFNGRRPRVKARGEEPQGRRPRAIVYMCVYIYIYINIQDG